jgi:hypothetical protein
MVEGRSSVALAGKWSLQNCFNSIIPYIHEILVFSRKEYHRKLKEALWPLLLGVGKEESTSH